MIMTCTCNHQAQDAMHGVGKRVHNPCAKGQRCTVCGNIKTSGEVKKESK